MTENYLSKGRVRRIIREKYNTRIAESAVDALAEQTNMYIDNLVGGAVELASHAGRKTVQGEDIKLANRGI